MMAPEPEPIGFFTGLACAYETRAWAVGKRLFKTQYGAHRYIAKCLLLAEIDAEVRRREAAFYNDRVGLEWVEYDYEQEYKRVFRERYGRGYAGHHEAGYSPFAEAVTRRVQELRRGEHAQVPVD